MRLPCLVFAFLTLSGCATTRPASMPVSLIEMHENGSNLLRPSMPSGDMAPVRVEADPKIKDKISKVVSQFNRNGDQLLAEIFAPIYGEKEMEIQLVVTDGIPQPYDAWTAEFKGKPAVFINSSVWDVARIDRALLPVIKHEISHVLMSSILAASSSKPEDELNLIVVNEGIAHFIGYVREREEILRDKVSECERAEHDLARAFEGLRLATSKDERGKILKNANTGSFWQKFGSIGGMCRAARVYEKLGAAGLTTAIINSSFPTAD